MVRKQLPWSYRASLKWKLWDESDNWLCSSTPPKSLSGQREDNCRRNKLVIIQLLIDMSCVEMKLGQKLVLRCPWARHFMVSCFARVARYVWRGWSWLGSSCMWRKKCERWIVGHLCTQRWPLCIYTKKITFLIVSLFLHVCASKANKLISFFICSSLSVYQFL